MGKSATKKVNTRSQLFCPIWRRKQADGQGVKAAEDRSTGAGGGEGRQAGKGRARAGRGRLMGTGEVKQGAAQKVRAGGSD